MAVPASKLKLVAKAAAHGSSIGRMMPNSAVAGELAVTMSGKADHAVELHGKTADWRSAIEVVDEFALSLAAETIAAVFWLTVASGSPLLM